MEKWYSKNLGDGLTAFKPSEEIQEAFFAFVIEQQGTPPADAAVFSRDDFETNSVIVYFTPSTDKLASAFGATPCDKPSHEENLSLLVGNSKSLDIHFPNRK